MQNPKKKNNQQTASNSVQNRNRRRRARKAPQSLALARALVRQPRLQMDPIAARYLRCVKGGSPAGTGVPDGDGRLAIVMNKRYLTVIKPVNGVIRFILGFSGAGSVSILDGDTDIVRVTNARTSTPSNNLTAMTPGSTEPG